MSLPRIIYLLLAVAGAIMTWTFNLQFMQEAGGAFDLGRFLADSSTNAASKSLSWDLAIACIAGLVWLVLEARRLGMRFAWMYVLLTFGVAWAFAFPLFLFMRQGKLEQSQVAAS
ncbi:MAG: DUF2834 domain-containing protein [Halioglobus sp.]|nr:DUF2834 domain-containing protein [Halioglobus sp.]